MNGKNRSRMIRRCLLFPWHLAVTNVQWEGPNLLAMQAAVAQKCTVTTWRIMLYIYCTWARMGKKTLSWLIILIAIILTMITKTWNNSYFRQGHCRPAHIGPVPFTTLSPAPGSAGEGEQGEVPRRFWQWNISIFGWPCHGQKHGAFWPSKSMLLDMAILCHFELVDVPSSLC